MCRFTDIANQINTPLLFANYRCILGHQLMNLNNLSLIKISIDSDEKNETVAMTMQKVV